MNKLIAENQFKKFLYAFIKRNNIFGEYDKLFKKSSSLRAIFYGASGSGKSYLCNKIIEQIHENYKKIIYFYGSTNDSIKHANIPNIRYVFLENKKFKNQIRAIFSIQKNLKLRSRKKILIVVDDIQAHLKACKHLFGALTYCRHLKIDVFMLCQYYTMIPPLVRYQCSHSIFKKIQQENMISQVYQNMSSFKFNEKDFIKFVRLFQRKYMTLIVDHTKDNKLFYSN